jgi:hypothetical protein
MHLMMLIVIFIMNLVVIRIHLSKCTMHKILSQGPVRDNHLLLIMYVLVTFVEVIEFICFFIVKMTKIFVQAAVNKRMKTRANAR